MHTISGHLGDNQLGVTFRSVNWVTASEVC